MIFWFQYTCRKQYQSSFLSALSLDITVYKHEDLARVIQHFIMLRVKSWSHKTGSLYKQLNVTTEGYLISLLRQVIAEYRWSLRL